MKNIIKKYYIQLILTIISFFILYPHSIIVDFFWFIGSYISPGNNNYTTGIIVLTFLLLTLGIVFFTINYIKNIIKTKI